MVRTGVVAFGAALAASSLALASPAGAAVSITYYSGFTDTGSGVTVDPATKIGTGTASSFQLGDLQPSAAVNTAANWPGGGTTFGAILDESLDLKSGGTYTLSLDSDDGSYLYVNGVRVLSDGGAHAQHTVSGPVTLLAGLNKIEIQYDNSQCCTAGVNLTGLPPAIDPPPNSGGPGVPEPTVWAMMLLGAFSLGAVLRYRRREAMESIAAA